MAIEYCEYCHEYVDLDYNSEHFLKLTDGAEVCAKRVIIYDDGIVTDEDGWVLGEVEA